MNRRAAEKKLTRRRAGGVRVRDAKVLKLTEDDVIVLRASGRLSIEELAKVRAAGVDAFPGHKVVAVDQGIDLLVVRRDELSSEVAEQLVEEMEEPS